MGQRASFACDVLDVFRFADDGRFAFCREFSDWTLLQEWEYLDF